MKRKRQEKEAVNVPSISPDGNFDLYVLLRKLLDWQNR